MQLTSEKKKTVKDKGVQPVPHGPQHSAPNIPKSNSMLSSSAASLKRPVSLKCNKDTELAEDAELLREEVASLAAEGAVLDPVLSAKESAATGPKDASESSLKRIQANLCLVSSARPARCSRIDLRAMDGSGCSFFTGHSFLTSSSEVHQGWRKWLTVSLLFTT
jgi:hypothetical protein